MAADGALSFELPSRAKARPVAIVMLVREHAGPQAPSRVLAMQRYTVHVATTATEAQRLTLTNPNVGIAIVDLSGEGYRGLELWTSLVQRLPADRDVSVIFLARSPSVNDAVRALRLGAADLLRSPVDPAHLVDTVLRTEAALMRRSSLRKSVQDLSSMVGSLQTGAATMMAALQPEPAETEVVNGRVEFTEPLDALAQREDTSSLAYTQRQRRHVAAAIKAQALRRDLLSPGLVGDPCWDMLLDLHEKSLMGRAVSVSSLCSVAVAPATTALRRLDDMVAAGLITRVRDSDDARRVLVRLTESGTQKLRSYFDAVGPGG